MYHLKLGSRYLSLLCACIALGATMPSRAQAPLTIIAPFDKSGTPVADGVIGFSEYGPGLSVDFLGDSNPGRFWTGSNKLSATLADVSFTMYAAHTNSTLFLAFRVSDQFLDNQTADAALPFYNDGIELFFNADRVNNDFTPGNKEGFQILSDVIENKLTVAGTAFTNADWTVGVGSAAGGYDIEFAIPLNLLDTVDGAGFAAAKSGDVLGFNAAVNDNDQLISSQLAQGVLWRAASGASPFGTREPGWVVDLVLQPVPEPGTLALLAGLAASGAAFGLRRRLKR